NARDWGDVLASSARTRVADKTPEFGSGRRVDLAAGTSGMIAVLVAATVVASLYFAREVFVPITLAVLLSFLLAPAVRLLRRLRLGRVPAVGVTVLLAFIAIAGFATIVVGEVSPLAQQLPVHTDHPPTSTPS